MVNVQCTYVDYLQMKEIAWKSDKIVRKLNSQTLIILFYFLKIVTVICLNLSNRILFSVKRDDNAEKRMTI